jgi:putative flavoprotein involved in K+ transport
VYVLGLPLMRRRKSSFIYGIEDDAKDITNHLFNYLNSSTGSIHNGFYQDDSGKHGIRRSA